MPIASTLGYVCVLNVLEDHMKRRALFVLACLGCCLSLVFAMGQTPLSKAVIVTPIPEPGILALLGTGLLGIAGIIRRPLS